MKKRIILISLVCVLVLIVLMVVAKEKVDMPSHLTGKTIEVPVNLNSGPYNYFVLSSYYIETDKYQVGLRKVRERLPGLVVSREKADIVINISSGNCVIPGWISIDYREDASSIVNFILANTVEAIILQKEEAIFSKLSLDLEKKFAQEKNVFICKLFSSPLSAKDYYRFLLRLRGNPECVRIMQESGVEWIAGKEFYSYNRIDSQANFKEINDFLLRSIALFNYSK